MNNVDVDNLSSEALFEFCLLYGIGIEVDIRRAVSLCGKKSRWAENNLQDCIKQVVLDIVMRDKHLLGGSCDKCKSDHTRHAWCNTSGCVNEYIEQQI